MLVAIDAGHGHNTPGKRCPDDSMREHDFNGNVATKVCNILNENGIETYRSDDITGNTDVPLITRTNNINSKNADICVSIHANAYTGQWNDANGIETYIIARGGEAEKIANIVQRKLIENTGRKDRGVKVSNLHMCRETKMPAILCECGFMDNKEEAELLDSMLIVHAEHGGGNNSAFTARVVFRKYNCGLRQDQLSTSAKVCSRQIVCSLSAASSILSAPTAVCVGLSNTQSSDTCTVCSDRLHKVTSTLAFHTSSCLYGVK